jgi:hypothetical protein
MLKVLIVRGVLIKNAKRLHQLLAIIGEFEN